MVYYYWLNLGLDFLDCFVQELIIVEELISHHEFVIGIYLASHFPVYSILLGLFLLISFWNLILIFYYTFVVIILLLDLVLCFIRIFVRIKILRLEESLVIFINHLTLFILEISLVFSIILDSHQSIINIRALLSRVQIPVINDSLVHINPVICLFLQIFYVFLKSLLLADWVESVVFYFKQVSHLIIPS